MTSRPWSWLRSRIEGLLTEPDTRIARHLAAASGRPPSEGVGDDGA